MPEINSLGLTVRNIYGNLDLTCFKLTKDEWYPSYKIHGYHKGILEPRLVSVSCCALLPRPVAEMGITYTTTQRVCVWGQDDFGMEKDFETSVEAFGCYLILLAKEYINIKDLEKMGFSRA